ncbi:20S proteasome subunit alpha 1 [Nematocida major]|uniref:20S proteasome subunit alpha 1 n=1 Tax=Nematocida major TaxID=1912982 RepID=UPI0020081DEC|nr:20S proteasome subunit alpha 1 [Nematocida major]KAH9386579.1 20S proteasome subunit alpha 1 [Nematocida major]
MSNERINNDFSKEGTLYQVEYALEAAKKGMPCVIVGTPSCIVMAASKRLPEKLMDPEYISSFFEILPGVVGVASGYLMDIQITVSDVKKAAMDLYHDLGEVPTPDIIAREMADKFQLYTQESYKRISAVFLAIVGYEKECPMIYYTDSSGILLPYKAVAFGEGGSLMMKKLEKLYTPEQTQEQATENALISLSEALGADYLATNVELAVFTAKEGLRRATTDEIDGFLVEIAEKI